jgi:hypothetical protein
MYSNIKDLFNIFKLRIFRKYLLLVAGLVWLSAGNILFLRGSSYIFINGHHKFVEIIIASIIGALFYILLFIKISLKHITRITSIEVEKPSVFSFFDVKGYIIMCIMIATGITLRHLKIINPDYLYTFYIGMGIPLIISSLSFFKVWYKDTGI